MSEVDIALANHAEKIEAGRSEFPFAADWVTKGWKEFDGIWRELGASASVKDDAPDLPPPVGLHDVAPLLNAYKEKIKQLEAQIATMEERWQDSLSGELAAQALRNRSCR